MLQGKTFFWLVVSLPEFSCAAEVLLTCAALAREQQRAVHTSMTLCACWLQGAAPLQVATQKGYASTTNVLLSHGAIAPL